MAAEDLDADDFLFPDASKKKAAAAIDELRVANLYLVFDSEVRAKALLTRWSTFVRARKIPPNATIQEYAAANAVREFVEGIYAQIELAHNRGNLPQ